MSKQLAKAVKDLLDQIEDEAESSYQTGPQRIFNDKIWKENDPVLFGLCSKIKKILKADGL